MNKLSFMDKRIYTHRKISDYSSNCAVEAIAVANCPAGYIFMNPDSAPGVAPSAAKTKRCIQKRWEQCWSAVSCERTGANLLNAVRPPLVIAITILDPNDSMSRCDLPRGMEPRPLKASRSLKLHISRHYS